MLISAINKLTLVDYPGKCAAIIFTAGCNMRCGYCHNSQFVLPEKIDKIRKHFIPFEVVKKFLQSRKGLLDAVVFCGGEPTMHKDLVEKCKEVKKIGFLVKVDSNGLQPRVIQELIDKNLVDYFAIDIKAPLDQSYSDLTAVDINLDALKETISIITNSGIKYEFRSTILPKFHTKERLLAMAKSIQGAQLWALQNFRNGYVLDPKFKEEKGFKEEVLQELDQLLSPFVENLELRI